MPSKRKFYKTTLTVTVVSDYPLDGLPLVEIAMQGVNGDISVRASRKAQEIDGPAAAKALIEQESEPEFLGLTEDGEDD